MLSGREIREMIADIINSIERIVPYAVEISYDELMIGRNRLRLAIRSQSGYLLRCEEGKMKPAPATVSVTGSRFYNQAGVFISLRYCLWFHLHGTPSGEPL